MWSSWAAAQPALALHALQPKKAHRSSLSRKPTTQLSAAVVNGPSLEARPTSVGSAALDRPTTSIPTKSLRRS